MIKLKLLLIAYFYFFSCSIALSSDQKIVYLNLDHIVKSSIPGKLIISDLENKKKVFIEKFKSRENKLKDKEKDIINKKNILSEEEFKIKVTALNKEMKIYNNEKKKIFLEFEENKKKKT